MTLKNIVNYAISKIERWKLEKSIKDGKLNDYLEKNFPDHNRLSVKLSDLAVRKALCLHDGNDIHGIISKIMDYSNSYHLAGDEWQDSEWISYSIALLAVSRNNIARHVNYKLSNYVLRGIRNDILKSKILDYVVSDMDRADMFLESITLPTFVKVHEYFKGTDKEDKFINYYIELFESNIDEKGFPMQIIIEGYDIDKAYKQYISDNVKNGNPGQ